MGFFAEFNAWLNAILAGYIADHTARIAGALEPAIVTLGVLYVMVWGYLELTGRIEEPFIGGVKRIVTLAVILGCALHLWLYNSVIVDTFFNAPAQLGAVVVGTFDPVSVVDQILFAGGDAANLLLTKGGLFSGLSYTLAGIGVYVVVGLTAIYTMFLLALSRIALSVLLALGPLFMALFLFESSRRFVEAWLAQLANYAFVTILTVLVAALMLRVVTVAAQQAVSQGGSIDIASAVRVCMAAGLTLLVMRQVMPMAAGLANGLALSSFNVVSSAVAWGLGGALRGSGQFTRGLTDRENPRWGSFARQAGYGLRSGLARAVSASRRHNEIRRSA